MLEQSGFYVSGVEEVASGRMQTLQAIHIQSVASADFVVAKDAEFDRVQIERRQLHRLPSEQEIYLASPEDLILSKMRWGKPSQSEKQYRDVLAILKTQAEKLDEAYLEEWATRLGVLDWLERAKTEAGF